MAELRIPQLTIAAQSGTSFPSSPATGLLFLRTDLGLEFYYDGTRWLTTELFEDTFGTADVLSPVSVSGQGSGRFVSASLDMWLENWTSTLIALTTNNATNYWSVVLRKVDSSNTGTTLDTRTTAADTVGVWSPVTRSLGVVLSVATYLYLDTVPSKVGGPSNLYYMYTLRYRLIGT